MSYFRCFIYFMFTGFVAFCIGRAMPKNRIKTDAFPFRLYDFEQNGRIYDSLNVKSWQNRLPDMSKMLPGTMPKKKLSAELSAESLNVMIRETCVSEITHYVLIIIGIGCFKYVDGKAGLAVYLFYVCVNLVYAMIQRYNRPRLQRVLTRYEKNPIQAQSYSYL